jgi:hypothetical protein
MNDVDGGIAIRLQVDYTDEDGRAHYTRVRLDHSEAAQQHTPKLK